MSCWEAHTPDPYLNPSWLNTAPPSWFPSMTKTPDPLFIWSLFPFEHFIPILDIFIYCNSQCVCLSIGSTYSLLWCKYIYITKWKELFTIYREKKKNHTHFINPNSFCVSVWQFRRAPGQPGKIFTLLLHPPHMQIIKPAWVLCDSKLTGVTECSQDQVYTVDNVYGKSLWAWKTYVVGRKTVCWVSREHKHMRDDQCRKHHIVTGRHLCMQMCLCEFTFTFVSSLLCLLL